MFKNPGTKWPIIIALSIAGIIGACIWTIKVALNNPVELSNYGMQNYHDYDSNVNQIISDKIAFDHNYTIAFLTPQITEKGSTIEYKVSDKSGKAVNDAKLEVILTRPDLKEFDTNLSNPVVAEGKYTFAPIDLPKAGRWDIMAKISVGNLQRYYNIKADTRKPEISEF
jgi:hypothetical protein